MSFVAYKTLVQVLGKFGGVAVCGFRLALTTERVDSREREMTLRIETHTFVTYYYLSPILWIQVLMDDEK